ncbi:hypothetical protein H9Y04_27675 [Streptomyces sp. TRM66268-LWL]|uniref:Uncharacterized protein n=1 Tax=Streptomyces polyasparticus TaxID=2767826 RepID=A0ABR7SPT2_9ACTN|nr:hypothetical protein [Streptomyces polyasparticus]MBC9716323.1 hypothetical protein [Streptomyces polyasparticus]
MIGDGAVLLWILLWAALALLAYRLVQLLSGPADDVETAGRRFSDGLTNAGETASRVPFVGGKLDQALTNVAGAGDKLAQAGDNGGTAVDALAAAGSIALFVLPVGLILALWLPRRLRWSRQAEAAQELAASDDGRELLALRSLLRPLDEVSALARTADLPDATPGALAEGWRGGDPHTLDVLAEAELERLGLRTA